tara:strand:- start:659 stop:958 length:300 start_codon:yes stop_codon:yes gene_type:complete
MNAFPSTEISEAIEENQTAAESPVANPVVETTEEASVTFTPGTKLREIERIVILETLKQKNFNRTHTARALGIGIRTLQRKLKRYGASYWGLKNWKTDA